MLVSIHSMIEIVLKTKPFYHVLYILQKYIQYFWNGNGFDSNTRYLLWKKMKLSLQKY